MVLDNYALEQWPCPAKYLLRIIRRRVPIRKAQAPAFGAVVHAGLAAYYRNGGDESAAIAAIRAHWPEVLPSDDFRTRDYAETVVLEYARRYPITKEAWTLIPGVAGPLVEHPFTLNTGLATADGEPILYGGILDLPVQMNGNTYILDHKTSTRFGEKDDGTPGSDSFFLPFQLDNQITGYVWAVGKLTGKRVGGAIINGIGLYKTGRVAFGRRIVTRSDFAINEWLETVRAKANEIRRAERTGEFRLETTQCVGKYGKCEYFDVHVLPDAEARERRLAAEYVESPWDHEQRDD